MVLLRVQCGEGLVPLGFLRYFAWYSPTMRTTIDKAGRVVIPAAIRDRAGLTPGTELEITVDDTSVRIERVAPGPKLVRVGRRLVARPTPPPRVVRPSTSPRSSKTSATGGRERFPRHERAPRGACGSRPAKRSGAIDHARRCRKDHRIPGHRVALLPRVLSVATRLPPEFRLTPHDAARLLEEEVLARMEVHDLPAADRRAMLRQLVDDGIGGGRIYDVHIAEIARAAGARVIVTDNRRHFLSALRHDLRVETPAEFLAGLRKPRSSCWLRAVGWLDRL